MASCCREKGLKRCGDCRFVGCQLLPEYKGERKSLEHLEMVRLEALGGSTRAMELSWIFRLYDANGAQLEQIGSRRAVLWRNMAWWTAAADVVTYTENIARSWTSGGRMFWLWMEELPDAVFFLLAGMLNLLSWVLSGAWLALILLRWVQLYRTAGEFRRLGACGKQSC